MCTIVNAALFDRIFGLGFSIWGAGGGRAATCGAAASGDRDVEDGIIVGDESLSGSWGWRSGPGRMADIMARRMGMVEAGQHG